MVERKMTERVYTEAEVMNATEAMCWCIQNPEKRVVRASDRTEYYWHVDETKYDLPVAQNTGFVSESETLVGRVSYIRDGAYSVVASEKDPPLPALSEDVERWCHKIAEEIHFGERDAKQLRPTAEVLKEFAKELISAAVDAACERMRRDEAEVREQVRTMFQTLYMSQQRPDIKTTFEEVIDQMTALVTGKGE
jgi:hypothetical protein